MDAELPADDHALALLRDRRWVSWFDEYVKNTTACVAATPVQ